MMKRASATVVALLLLALAAAWGGADTTYEYDQLGRLVRVNYGNGSHIEYSYDLAGNRTSRNVSNASVATGSVQVSVDPDTAAWTFTDSLGVVHNGTGDSTVSGVPVGPVSLFWQPPSGYGAPSPNPEVRMVSDGATASFSQSLIVIPATPTRTQTPVPTTTPTATPTITPTPTPTAVFTPAEFETTQSVWVDASGIYEFVYVSAWDYTGNAWLSGWVALGDQIGSLDYDLPVDHWVGIFIYDVTLSQYTSMFYVLRDSF